MAKINMCLGLNTKLMFRPRAYINNITADGSVSDITFYYPDVPYGVVFIVKYTIINNEIVDESVIGGWLQNTEKENQYLRIPYDIILDFYNKNKYTDDNYLYLDILKTLRKYNYNPKILFDFK